MIGREDLTFGSLPTRESPRPIGLAVSHVGERAYSIRLARQLAVSGRVRNALALEALLHDMGKIGIPDRILLKSGALTDEERCCMRKHPVTVDLDGSPARR